MVLVLLNLQKDVRNPSHAGCTWSVGADVESLAWDPHAENLFAVRYDYFCPLWTNFTLNIW